MNKSLLMASCLLAGCTGMRLDTPPSPELSSWTTLREQRVVMQGYDYSCGAAALATLLTHYFDDPVSEPQMLQTLLSVANIERMRQVEELGFSLLDLKKAAEVRGYRALGLRMSLDDLRTVGVPALVYLETTDYKHFAILRNVTDQRVYLADPSRGNIRLSRAVFETQWPGIVLLVENPDQPLPESTEFARLPTIERPEAEAVREMWLSYRGLLGG